MKFSARKYVLWTLGLTATVLSGIVLLNYFIDPYNRFGNNRLGVYISAEREAKPTWVRTCPHDALLMGNSKAAMIPVSGLNGFHFFNASFGGATTEEIYYFIEHFARDEKLILLSADLGQCDPPLNKGDLFAPPDWETSLDSLLNAKTTEYSVRTIADHWTGKPPGLLADGSFDASGWFKLYDHENKTYLQWQLNDLQRQRDNTSILSLQHMSFYVKIAQVLRQRGIACVVFVPPLYPAMVDHLRTSPRREALLSWKVELQKIFPNLVDLATSSYCTTENFFKSDAVHFKPEIGVRLLNEKVIPMAIEVVHKNVKPIALPVR